VQFIDTFPLYVVVFDYENGGHLYYAGPDKGKGKWTEDLSKAKFYHTKGHAEQAVWYHHFSGAIIKHVTVGGELYA
jgi:hypothetical protein